MEELSIGNSEVALNLNPNTIIEEGSALGDNFLTIYDPETSSMVIKGILDQAGTGAIFIDSTQFANFIMEQQHGHGLETSSGMVK